MSKALAKRVGAWVCSDPLTAAEKTQSAHHSTTDAPSPATIRPMDSIEDYWCIAIGNANGCYDVHENKAYADFRTNSIRYGYGTSFVGKVSINIDWKTNGKQFVVKPMQFTNSLATTRIIIAAVVKNGAKNQEGSPVSDVIQKQFGSTAAGKLVVWAASPVDTHNSIDLEAMSSFQWWVPNYPGHWWVIVKSPVVHAPDRHSYFFNSNKDLALNTLGAGANVSCPC